MHIQRNRLTNGAALETGNNLHWGNLALPHSLPGVMREDHLGTVLCNLSKDFERRCVVHPQGNRLCHNP